MVEMEKGMEVKVGVDVHGSKRGGGGDGRGCEGQRIYRHVKAVA